MLIDARFLPSSRVLPPGRAPSSTLFRGCPACRCHPGVSDAGFAGAFLRGRRLLGPQPRGDAASSPVRTGCTQRFPKSAGTGRGPLRPPPPGAELCPFCRSSFWTVRFLCKLPHVQSQPSVFMDESLLLSVTRVSEPSYPRTPSPLSDLAWHCLPGRCCSQVIANNCRLPCEYFCFTGKEKPISLPLYSLFFFLPPSVFCFKRPLSEEKHLQAKGCTAGCRGCAPHQPSSL